MKLQNLAGSDVGRALAGSGLTVRMGPFVSRIHSGLPEIAQGMRLLYGEYLLGDDGEFADFNVTVTSPNGIRKWFGPQVVFDLDGRKPFHPLPRNQAFPLLEWGLNWSIAAYAHQYLIVHAAAIEKDGLAAIMPAPPGSGKSTLCAALVNRGWRLLSDELALLSMDAGMAVPLARPINLKNESIEIIKQHVPGAVFGGLTAGTKKGDVALLKAPSDSIARSGTPAKPAWVIFPKYETNAPVQLVKRSKARTCIEIGRNAFNYSIHGATGFRLLTHLLDECSCYEFVYGDLDEAIEVFSDLPLDTQ